MSHPEFPVTPNHSSQIHQWLTELAKAISEGDTNPHIALRRIVGRVYADGYQDGRVSSYFDRPLAAAVAGDAREQEDQK